MEKAKTACELCGGAAAVHCAADSAFLCLRCDARVHGANFLASRHQRRRLGAEPATSSASSASSSSSCVSTADSAESTAASSGRKPQRRRARAEAVLEGWAKRMGFGPGAARRRAAGGRGRAPCAGQGRGRGPRPAPRRHGRRALVRGLFCLRGRMQAGRRRRRRAALPAGGHRARAGAAGADRGGVDGARSRRPAAAEEGEEGWAECS
ncbi:hypothetical protein PR202_ga06624 [Eleusine coracana subsp. coracana]|uniref:B box-type domain-containing protein n=1 Tax=Eleusine coracana subsp. coracana TaxID=191504 RepID=A0AAV5BWM3_ELECO|nr:hypothetical protein PR202_ga06624 [Eleusine coracana subsp. coracana]